MKKITRLIVVTTVAYFGLGGVPSSWAITFGAYCGKDTSWTVSTTRGFITVTGYTQWFYAPRSIFNYVNDQYIDSVNFAVFAGHGGAFEVNTLTDDWYGFDGREGNPPFLWAGNTSNGGWGDGSLRHMVFQSCSVVPSPIEESSPDHNGHLWHWWSWREDCGVWTGVRHIIGYRTDVYIDAGQDILHDYANRLVSGETVMSAWWNAIDAYGNPGEGMDYGAIVYAPSATGDDIFHDYPAVPSYGPITMAYQD